MFKVKKAGDFFILHLLYVRRSISSEVIASVAKLKKKKSGVWIALFCLNP